MATSIGYCTYDDVRRVAQEASFDGALGQDRELVLQAICGQTTWVQKQTHKHWYEPGGISEDSDGIVATGTLTRDDEHDLPTHAGYVAGAYGDGHARVTATTGTVFDSASGRDPNPKQEIRLAFGDLDDETVPAYTRIRFDRRDVDTVNELNVVNADGGFDDWIASNDYTGGVGTANRGDDFWVRRNNDGDSELYIDVHALDDDIASLSNAVYVDFDYGADGLPDTVRRAVAMRAFGELIEEPAFQIPDNATVYNVESKADALHERAAELLEPWLLGGDD